MRKIKEILKEQKGITLIALVITIVILLILAAVTISMLTSKDGLLSKAQESRETYVFEEENERVKLALLDLQTEKILQGEDITVEDLKTIFGDKVKIVECDSEGNEKIAAITPKIATETQSDAENIIVAKYVKIIFLDSQNWFVVNLQTGLITWTNNGAVDNNDTGEKGETKDITIEYKGVKLKVGDYVNYQPINQEESYSKNEGNNTWTINYEDSMKWRVLGLTDNGQLELISAAPTIDAISEYENSYNNWVYLLNDICSKLYGNNNNGSIARNLKIEDIEKTMDLNYWDYHNFITRGSGYKYNEVEEFGSVYYQEIFALEKGYMIDGKEGTELGLSEQYELIDESKENNYGRKIANTSIKARNTYWSEQVTSDYFVNPIYYELFITEDRWYGLASRCVEISINSTGQTYICYATRHVSPNRWIDGRSAGYGNCNSADMSLRPVVTLGDSVEINSDTQSEQHTTPETAWNLKE